MVGDVLAGVRVVEPELKAAVVAHRHGGGSQPHDLDVVGVAGVDVVTVVTPVDGGQSGPDDRVRAAWAVHRLSIGRLGGTA